MITCSHCGLPVPAGLVEAEAQQQFCCAGCRTAWEIIHDHNLERYYDIRLRLEAPSQKAMTSGAGFEEMDDPAFTELYVRSTPDGLAAVDLYLEGVHCAACVWLVERVSLLVEGVAEVRLDLGRARARVVWDPGTTALSTVARLLDGIGYRPHPYRAGEAPALEQAEDRSLLIRTAVAGAVAGNVMLLAFALYGGYLHGIADEYRRLFRWVSFALTVPSVLWCARVFYGGAWGALKTRALHMDVPISIGILAGFSWGGLNTIRDTGEVYFDSVAVLVFFLLVGRILQRRQQRAAARSTELLFALTPTIAHRVEGDDVHDIPIAALTPNQLVEVRAGESVPADGMVTTGSSTIDLSLLTGESRPVEVDPGDAVHAGTVNISGALRVQVTDTGEATRVGRLLRLVEEGAQRRAAVVRLADRLSAWFVAAVLVLAAATAGLWFVIDPSRAIEHTVALLIVSCPCALGLATPLAVSAAIGRAARLGILVKGGDALETLSRPGRMILDKTGTLTEGRLAVVHWTGSLATRARIAAAESCSSHPAARALAETTLDTGSMLVEDVHQETGRGLTARCDGLTMRIGSPAFISETYGPLPDELAEAVEAVVGDGLSPVVIAEDGLVTAIAGLGDPLREDSPDAVAAIRARGWRIEVLSGDHPTVVRSVAGLVGIPERSARGGASPEDKLRRAREATLVDTTVMVGDGVNDAAALAAASVGIGVHGGAEATLVAADVYLDRPGLQPVVDLLDGARRTMGVIRRNLGLSLAYNLVAISLAMAGMMHPLVAAILMPLSSMTVVVSSYRARTFYRR